MASFTLSPDQAQEEAQLLAMCKQFQGEYLPAHHGRGSFATTYSWEFINASCALYRIYCGAELSPWDSKQLQRISRGHDGLRKANLHLWIIGYMAQRFQDTGVSSCRGSKMTFSIVEYLYNTHLKQILKPTSDATDGTAT